MKYTVRYYPNGKYNSEADEILILYDKFAKTDRDDFEDFCEEHKHQRVLILIDGEKDAVAAQKNLNKINRLRVENVMFLLNVLEESSAELMKELKLPYGHSVQINDFLTLDLVLAREPKRIIIGGELQFSAFAVKRMCGACEVAIRPTPSVRGEKVWTYDFLLPETLNEEYIEQACDIIDLSHITDSRMETYYHIYKDNKNWIGKLSELFPQVELSDDFMLRFLEGKFNDARLSCALRCLRNRHCKLCENCVELAKTLEEMEDEMYGSKRK
jgi:hypothetical protein